MGKTWNDTWALRRSVASLSARAGGLDHLDGGETPCGRATAFQRLGESGRAILEPVPGDHEAADGWPVGRQPRHGRTG